MSRYMVWAQWCLKHRIKTTLAAAAFLVGSLMLVPLLPTGFIPPDDLSPTQVTVSLPPGSTFAQTFAAAEQSAHWSTRTRKSSSSTHGPLGRFIKRWR